MGGGRENLDVDEPSLDDLGAQARIAELEAMVATLVEQNQRLLDEVTKLRHLLDRHSGNSGKPPSSDTVTQRQRQTEERLSRQERRRLARAKAKELVNKDKTKRAPGKQPGEAGSRLDPVDEPDDVVEHRPDACSGCGHSLVDADVVDVEARQVFDLPTRRLEVVEHRAATCRCECGTTTKAAFPAAARGTTCYGPGVRALGCYLVGRHHLPVARAAELLADAVGAPVSTGWLAGLTAEAAAGLEPFLEVLRGQLIAADVLHADETGARINGARWWFHVACTDLLTLLDCHEKRGHKAFNAMGVLPFFTGVLVTDGWKPYWSIGAADHALCCAHLLRDLASVSQVASQAPWADGMADLLVEVKGAVETAGIDGLTPAQLKGFRSRYTKVLTMAAAANPEPAAGGKRNTLETESNNLRKRFNLQRADIQRHWHTPGVAFTNNAAEQAIRMVKLQQKISGSFRTSAGARAFCAVRSYLQTAAKHGVNHLHALTRLFEGDPWMPPPAPG